MQGYLERFAGVFEGLEVWLILIIVLSAVVLSHLFEVIAMGDVFLYKMSEVDYLDLYLL